MTHTFLQIDALGKNIFFLLDAFCLLVSWRLYEVLTCGTPLAFSPGVIAGLFFSFFLGYRGIVHPSYRMKLPNKPGLSPNNALENAFLSDQSMASNPRKGRAKRFGAKTTSHDGKAGHVMTHVCHCANQEQRRTIAGLDFTLALG